MAYYDSDIEEIREILKSAEYAVFFGGAGVSTECGIPDFRSMNGLYNSDDEDGENDGEYLMSRSCLLSEPERFFSFYRNNIAHPYAEPGDTHLALAELELEGIIKAVITQNIDGLHQKAGSKRVIELHGSGERCYCMHCGREYSKEKLNEFPVDGYSEFVPRCEKCEAIVRPAITLYGESPDGGALAEAEEEIAMADVLIVGGTSLSVNPAASLVAGFMGEHLIIINESPTAYDGLAEYVIRGSLAEVFQALAE